MTRTMRPVRRTGSGRREDGEEREEAETRLAMKRRPRVEIPHPRPATHLSANVKKRVKQILSIVLGRRRPGSLPRTLARARVNASHTSRGPSSADRVRPRSARARRRPPLSGDVRCHFVLSMRERLPGGRGFRRSGPRARGRSPGRERSPAGDRAMPRVTIVARARSRSRSIRPRGSTRAIVPAARHNLSLRRAESGRRSEGPVRARTRASARPGRRSRTTARDGRRIHADTAAPAPSAVARAPPHPRAAARASRPTSIRDDRPRPPRSTRYPSCLTSPRTKNSRSADFTHPASDRERPFPREGAHPRWSPSHARRRRHSLTALPEARRRPAPTPGAPPAIATRHQTRLADRRISTGFAPGSHAPSPPPRPLRHRQRLRPAVLLHHGGDAGRAVQVLQQREHAVCGAGCRCPGWTPPPIRRCERRRGSTRGSSSSGTGASGARWRPWIVALHRGKRGGHGDGRHRRRRRRRSRRRQAPRLRKPLCSRRGGWVLRPQRHRAIRGRGSTGIAARARAARLPG